MSICLSIAMILVCAHAQGDLRISSTSGCPDADAVRARIEAAAEGQPLPEGELAIERIERAVRYRGRLRLGGAAERTIEGDDCRSLVDAAALVVVMSLHRENAEEPPADPKNSPSEPPRPSASRRPAESVEDRPRAEKPAAFLRFALLGEVVTGLLPSVGAGGSLVLGAGFGVIGLQIDGSLFATQSTASPSDLTGDFGLASVGVRPCGHFGIDRLELTPCIGVSALRFSAAGSGTAQDRDESAWVAAPSLRLGTAWYFTPAIGVRLALEGSVLLGRPRFVIENDGPVHRPASLAGSAAIGPELRF